MKTLSKIVFLLMLAVFPGTRGMAQPTNPTNYCPWMGPDPSIHFGYHQIKTCAGSVVTTGIVGMYRDGYTYKWYNDLTTHWFTFPGAGLYWVDITKDGCTGRDSLEIVWVTRPKVNLGNDTTLCLGDSLVLDAGNPGASYVWNGNFSSTGNNQTFVVKNPGRYRVMVSVPGCAIIDTIQVNYQASSKFSLGPDQLICEGESVLLYPGNINAKYLWQDGSAKPAFTVSGPGTYSVRMDEACGTFYDTIIFTRTSCKLYVPNAFTPNNDGKNDVFKVEGYDNLSFFRFRIYDRGGTEVFFSSLPEKGWNGLLKGQLQPQGVYVWMLEYKKKYSPEAFLQKGTVTLIR